jgi:RHS repeat-associated protein
VVDEVGNWVNREEYTPYGETSFGSFARKRYRFTGKERDEESGLNYHRSRYYGSWVGRWMSCDPLGYKDGINPYIYVHNHPFNGVDSSGLEEVDVTHITNVSNLPKIAATGLEAGTNPSSHAWMGTGVYFNEAKSPFASMGAGSQLGKAASEGSDNVVLGTKLDTSDFRKIDFSEWQQKEAELTEKVRADPQRFDTSGIVKPGFGKDWVKSQTSLAVRSYWDNRLKGTPGAVMEFPSGQGADSGRIFVVRPDFTKARITPRLTILGTVEATAKSGGGMWKINVNISGFIFKSAAGATTLTLARSFIPMADEAITFIQLGGHHYVAGMARAFATSLVTGAFIGTIGGKLTSFIPPIPKFMLNSFVGAPDGA